MEAFILFKNSKMMEDSEMAMKDILKREEPTPFEKCKSWEIVKFEKTGIRRLANVLSCLKDSDDLKWPDPIKFITYNIKPIEVDHCPICDCPLQEYYFFTKMLNNYFYRSIYLYEYCDLCENVIYFKEFRDRLRKCNCLCCDDDDIPCDSYTCKRCSYHYTTKEVPPPNILCSCKITSERCKRKNIPLYDCDKDICGVDLMEVLCADLGRRKTLDRDFDQCSDEGLRMEAMLFNEDHLKADLCILNIGTEVEGYLEDELFEEESMEKWSHDGELEEENNVFRLYENDYEGELFSDGEEWTFDSELSAIEEEEDTYESTATNDDTYSSSETDSSEDTIILNLLKSQYDNQRHSILVDKRSFRDTTDVQEEEEFDYEAFFEKLYAFHTKGIRQSKRQKDEPIKETFPELIKIDEDGLFSIVTQKRFINYGKDVQAVQVTLNIVTSKLATPQDIYDQINTSEYRFEYTADNTLVFTLTIDKPFVQFPQSSSTSTISSKTDRHRDTSEEFREMNEIYITQLLKKLLYCSHIEMQYPPEECSTCIRELLEAEPPVITYDKLRIFLEIVKPYLADIKKFVAYRETSIGNKYLIEWEFINNPNYLLILVNNLSAIISPKVLRYINKAHLLDTKFSDYPADYTIHKLNRYIQGDDDGRRTYVAKKFDGNSSDDWNDFYNRMLLKQEMDILSNLEARKRWIVEAGNAAICKMNSDLENYCKCCKDDVCRLYALPQFVDNFESQQMLKEEALKQVDEQNKLTTSSDKRHKYMIEYGIYNCLLNSEEIMSYVKDFNYPLSEYAKLCLELCELCHPYTNTPSVNLPPSLSTIAFENDIKFMLSKPPKKYYLTKLYRKLSFPVLDRANYTVKHSFDINPVDLRWYTVNHPVSIFHLRPDTNVSFYDSKEYGNIIVKPYRKILAEVLTNHGLSMELSESAMERSKSYSIIIEDIGLKLGEYNYIMELNDSIGGPIKSKPYRDYYLYKEALNRYPFKRKIYMAMSKIRKENRLRKLLVGKTSLGKRLKFYSTYIKFMSGLEMECYRTNEDIRLFAVKEKNWKPTKELIRKRHEQIEHLYKYESEKEEAMSYIEEEEALEEFGESDTSSDRDPRLIRLGLADKRMLKKIKYDPSLLDAVNNFKKRLNGRYIGEERKVESVKENETSFTSDKSESSFNLVLKNLMKPTKTDFTYTSSGRKKLRTTYFENPEQKFSKRQERKTFRARAESYYGGGCGTESITRTKGILRRGTRYLKWVALKYNKLNEIFADNVTRKLKLGEMPFAKDSELETESTYSEIRPTHSKIDKPEVKLPTPSSPIKKINVIERICAPKDDCASYRSLDSLSSISYHTPGQLSPDTKKLPCYKPLTKFSEAKLQKVIDKIKRKSLEDMPFANPLFTEYTFLVNNAFRQSAFAIQESDSPDEKTFDSSVSNIQTVPNKKSNPTKTYLVQEKHGKLSEKSIGDIVSRKVVKNTFNKFNAMVAKKVSTNKQKRQEDINSNKHSMIVNSQTIVKQCEASARVDTLRSQRHNGNDNLENMTIMERYLIKSLNEYIFQVDPKMITKPRNKPKVSVKGKDKSIKQIVKKNKINKQIEGSNVRNKIKSIENSTEKCNKQSSLNNHKKSEDGKKKQSSENSRERCDKQSSLNNHKKSDDGKKKQSSENSRERCDKQSSLNNHKKSDDGKKKQSSENSRERCDKQTSLNNHKKSDDGKKKQSSENSRVRCDKQSSLNNHKKSDDGKKKQSSENSRERCNKQSSLNNHKKSDDGKKKQSSENSRERCDKQSSLNNHKKSDDGKKKQSSENSRERCDKQTSLNNHKKSDDGKKKQSSENSRERCDKQTSLNNHKKSDDGKKKQSSENSRERCDKQSSLNNHKKSDDGKKKQSSENSRERCDKQSSLNNHKKSDDGKKKQSNENSSKQLSRKLCDKKATFDNYKKKYVSKKVISYLREDLSSQYDKVRRKLILKKSSKNFERHSESSFGGKGNQKNLEKSRKIDNANEVYLKKKILKLEKWQKILKKYFLLDTIKGWRPTKSSLNEKSLLNPSKKEVEEIFKNVDIVFHDFCTLNTKVRNNDTNAFRSQKCTNTGPNLCDGFKLKRQELKEIESKFRKKKIKLKQELFKIPDKKKYGFYSMSRNCILTNLVKPQKPFADVENNIIRGNHYIFTNTKLLNEIKLNKPRRRFNKLSSVKFVKELQTLALKHFYKHLEEKWSRKSKYMQYIDLMDKLRDLFLTYFPPESETEDVLRKTAKLKTYCRKLQHPWCLCKKEISIFGSSSPESSASSTSKSFTEILKPLIDNQDKQTDKKSHDSAQSQFVKIMNAIKMHKINRFLKGKERRNAYAKKLCEYFPYADFNEALLQIMLKNRPRRYYSKMKKCNLKKYLLLYKPKRRKYKVSVIKYFNIEDKREIKLFLKVLPECYDISGDLGAVFTDDIMRLPQKLLSNFYAQEVNQKIKSDFESKYLHSKYAMTSEEFYMKQKFYNKGIKFGKNMLYRTKQGKDSPTGVLPLSGIMKYCLQVFENKKFPCIGLKNRSINLCDSYNRYTNQHKHLKNEEVKTQYKVSKVNSSEFIIGKDIFIDPSEKCVNRCSPIKVNTGTRSLCICIPTLQKYIKTVYMNLQEHKDYLKNQYHTAEEVLRYRELVEDNLFRRMYKVRGGRALQNFIKENEKLLKFVHEAAIIKSIYEIRVLSVQNKLRLLSNFMFRMEAYVISKVDFGGTLVKEITEMFIGEGRAVLDKKRELKLFSFNKPLNKSEWKLNLIENFGQTETTLDKLLDQIVNSFRFNRCNGIIYPIPFTTEKPTKKEIKDILFQLKPNKLNWKIKHDIRKHIDELLNQFDQIKDHFKKMRKCCPSVFPKFDCFVEKDLVYYHNDMCSLKKCTTIKDCPDEQEYTSDLKIKSVYSDDRLSCASSCLKLKTLYGGRKNVYAKDYDMADCDLHNDFSELLQDDYNSDECGFYNEETEEFKLKNYYKIDINAILASTISYRTEDSSSSQQDSNCSLDSSDLLLLFKLYGYPSEYSSSDMFKLMKSFKNEKESGKSSEFTEVFDYANVDRLDSNLREFVHTPYYEIFLKQPDSRLTMRRDYDRTTHVVKDYTATIDIPEQQFSSAMNKNILANKNEMDGAMNPNTDSTNFVGNLIRSVSQYFNYSDALKYCSLGSNLEVGQENILLPAYRSDDFIAKAAEILSNTVKNLSRYFVGINEFCNASPDIHIPTHSDSDENFLSVDDLLSTSINEDVNVILRSTSQDYNIADFENYITSLSAVGDDVDDYILTDVTDEICVKDKSFNDIFNPVNVSDIFIAIDQFEYPKFTEDEIEDGESSSISFIFEDDIICNSAIGDENVNKIIAYISQCLISFSEIEDIGPSMSAETFAVESAIEESSSSSSSSDDDLSDIDDSASFSSYFIFTDEFLKYSNPDEADAVESSSSSSEVELEDSKITESKAEEEEYVSYTSSLEHLLSAITKELELNILAASSLMIPSSNGYLDEILLISFGNLNDILGNKNNQDNVFDVRMLYNILYDHSIFNYTHKEQNTIFSGKTTTRESFGLNLFPSYSIFNKSKINKSYLNSSESFSAQNFQYGISSKRTDNAMKDKDKMMPIKNCNLILETATVIADWANDILDFTNRKKLYNNKLELFIRDGNNLKNNSKHYVDNIVRNVHNYLIPMSEFKYYQTGNILRNSEQYLNNEEFEYNNIHPSNVLAGGNDNDKNSSQQNDQNIKSIAVKGVSQYSLPNKKYAHSVLSPVLSVSDAKNYGSINQNDSNDAANIVTSISRYSVPNKEYAHSVLSPVGSVTDAKCAINSTTSYQNDNNIDSNDDAANIVRSVSHCKISHKAFKYSNSIPNNSTITQIETSMDLSQAKVDDVLYIKNDEEMNTNTLNNAYQFINKCFDESNAYKSDSDCKYNENESYAMFLQKTVLDEMAIDADLSIIGSLSDVSIGNILQSDFASVDEEIDHMFVNTLPAYYYSTYDPFICEQRELREFRREKSSVNILKAEQDRPYHMGPLTFQSRLPQKYFHHPLMEHKYHFSSLQDRPWWKREHFDLEEINHYWNKVFYPKWPCLYPLPTRHFNYHFLKMDQNPVFRRELLEHSNLPNIHERIKPDIEIYEKLYKAAKTGTLWDLYNYSMPHMINRLFIEDYAIWSTTNKPLTDLIKGRFTHEEEEVNAISPGTSVTLLSRKSLTSLSSSDGSLNIEIDQLFTFDKENLHRIQLKPLLLDKQFCEPELACKKGYVSDEDLIDLQYEKPEESDDDISSVEFFHPFMYLPPKRACFFIKPEYNTFKFLNNFSGLFPKHIDTDTRPHRIFDWIHTVPYTFKTSMPMEPCDQAMISEVMSGLSNEYQSKAIKINKKKEKKNKARNMAILKQTPFSQNTVKAIYTEVRRHSAETLVELSIDSEDETSVEANLNTAIDTFIGRMEKSHVAAYNEGNLVDEESGDENSLEDYLISFLVKKKGDETELPTVSIESPKDEPKTSTASYFLALEHVMSTADSRSPKKSAHRVDEDVKPEFEFYNYLLDKLLQISERNSLSLKDDEEEKKYLRNIDALMDALKAQIFDTDDQKSDNQILAEESLDNEIKSRIRKLKRELGSERYSIHVGEQEDTQKYQRNFAALENALRAKIISAMDEQSMKLGETKTQLQNFSAIKDELTARILSVMNEPKIHIMKPVHEELEEQSINLFEEATNEVPLTRLRTRNHRSKKQKRRHLKDDDTLSVSTISILELIGAIEKKVTESTPEGDEAVEKVFLKYNIKKMKKVVKKITRIIPKRYLRQKGSYIADMYHHESFVSKSEILEKFFNKCLLRRWSIVNAINSLQLRFDTNMYLQMKYSEFEEPFKNSLILNSYKQVYPDEPDWFQLHTLCILDKSPKKYSLWVKPEDEMPQKPPNVDVKTAKFPKENNLAANNIMKLKTFKIWAEECKDYMILMDWPLQNIKPSLGDDDDGFVKHPKCVTNPAFRRDFLPYIDYPKRKNINFEKAYPRELKLWEHYSKIFTEFKAGLIPCESVESDDSSDAFSKLAQMSVFSDSDDLVTFDIQVSKEAGVELSDITSISSLVTSGLDSELEEILMLSPLSEESVSESEESPITPPPAEHKVTFDDVTYTLEMLHEKLEELRDHVYEYQYVSNMETECDLRYLKSIISWSSDDEIEEGEGEEEEGIQKKRKSIQKTGSEICFDLVNEPLIYSSDSLDTLFSPTEGLPLTPAQTKIGEIIIAKGLGRLDEFDLTSTQGIIGSDDYMAEMNEPKQRKAFTNYYFKPDNLPDEEAGIGSFCRIPEKKTKK